MRQLSLALPRQPWPGSFLKTSSNDSGNQPQRITILGHLSSTRQEAEIHREKVTYAK